MIFFPLLLAVAVDAESSSDARLRLHRLRDARLGFVELPGKPGVREPLAIGWDALQTQQRTGPEYLFHESHNAGVSLSGPMQFALEHAGDLLHRAAFGDWGGGWIYGIGAVREKVDKLLRYARQTTRHPHDDPETSARRAFRYWKEETDPKWIPPVYRDVDEDTAIRLWREALLRYHDGYTRLRPLSRLQRMGRSVAMDLGRLDIPAATATLSRMQSLLEDAEHAGEEAEFDLYYRDRVPPSRWK